MEYKGKIIGDQNSCCEENRDVLKYSVPDEDSDPRLVVKCKVCGNTWLEVLD